MAYAWHNKHVPNFQDEHHKVCFAPLWPTAMPKFVIPEEF